MKSLFRTDKSYVIRHKILEFLYKDYEENDREKGRRIGSIKIASKTGISIADIHLLQHLLLEKGEIIVSDNDGQSMISIQENGINAFIDRRYLKDGSKSKLDGIYDWARIIIPFLALMFSLFNYFSNKNLNEKIKNIELRLNQFKK